MIFSILYIVLAAIGLGFLIFIHELGHYWMARREKMTVEVFSIGFGKPLYTWEYQGVKWQFCMLPFGGYVRIAGMEKKGALEPYEIADGFYGKKPLARIKVAILGPLVNIVFAFVAFCLLFVTGGREKPFSEFTHLIGWVDPASSLYHMDVRPGDELLSVNGKPLRQFQDLLYAAVLDDGPLKLTGSEIDYFSDAKKPFTYEFPFTKETSTNERIQGIWGSMGPASYLIYNRKAGPAGGSPIDTSGISYGDRIICVDGDVVFSREQLVATVNQSKALLTVKRGDQLMVVKVPRLKVSDLRITPAQRAELEDWQHEAVVKAKLSDLFFIPYDLSVSCTVENALSYLNEEAVEQTSHSIVRSALEVPLQVGDQIVAVDGIAVTSSYALLKHLQTRVVQVIVKKEDLSAPLSWKEADKAFVADIQWKDLSAMIQSIGTASPIKELGGLKMLDPITPKPRSEFPFPQEVKERYAKGFEKQRAAIEKIEDPEQREMALKFLDEAENQLMLGIVPADRKVIYNPGPVALFCSVFHETWRTLMALFSGSVSPKYMQGPVGIVQVMQHSWSVGFKEALFWLGMISLNLGVLNLMPIPVLDGGHICFSVWEWITKKPIKAKTMERLIIPFVILMVSLFVYLTYHDLMRLFSRFF
ncbi:MAG: site-2 protease family protein [Chlamydiota bacterium]